MIQPSTFAFLRKLAKNNTREWFHLNRESSHKARQNMFDLAAKLAVSINRFDERLGYPDPRKCLFRIARDTRFSKDKSPYKTNFGLILNAAGSVHSPFSCYYVHIEPGNCQVSAGVYAAEPETVKTLREAIDGNFEEFEGILSRKDFKRRVGGLVRDENALKRVPAGFDKESPAAEYLKLKHFYVHAPVSDAETMSPDFVKKAAALFKIMHPLNLFFDRAIEKRLLRDQAALRESFNV